MTLTASDLRPVLQSHAGVVDQALEVLFPDPAAPVNLDGLRAITEIDMDLADVLISVLQADGAQKIEGLRSFLNARGIDLVRRAPPGDNLHAIPTLPNAGIPQPDPNAFPLAAVIEFAPRAAAFRCQIQIDGLDKGSGVFISKSLVLTAGHVVEERVLADVTARDEGVNPPKHPLLEVEASDGKAYSARVIWHSPVHANERNGALPPADVAAQHLDVAVLRVGLPLGLSYGFCALPETPVNWTGARLMTLLHYPDGTFAEFPRGRVLRQAANDLRLPHDLDTEPGSSGGPAFDHDFTFIGIHQGRWAKFRKLVPHNVFADAPGFQAAIARDQPRPYLWSIEDDIDGQLVLGRRRFFEGLASMLENPDTTLRGIWVRRLDLSKSTGLSFSYQMLKAFLKNRRRPSDAQTHHRCFQIPTDLEEADLIQTIARQILGAEAAAAHAGVRAGETSDVALERERAHALAHDLQDRAADIGATFWLFFEAPPDGVLSEKVQTQFEHLTEWLVTHSALRVVLAGFEQYRLAPLMFQQVADGEMASRPGLVVDSLDRLTADDVRVTITAMMADLLGDDNPDPTEIDKMVADVLGNLDQVNGVYPFSQMAKAVEIIRVQVRIKAGLF